MGFSNKKVAFPWSGTIPQGWVHKPIPNPNSPKFVSVSGILAGIRTDGNSKRFHTDITMVTFLGPVPATYATQREYSIPRPMAKTNLPPQR